MYIESLELDICRLQALDRHPCLVGSRTEKSDRVGGIYLERQAARPFLKNSHVLSPWSKSRSKASNRESSNGSCSYSSWSSTSTYPLLVPETIQVKMLFYSCPQKAIARTIPRQVSHFGWAAVDLNRQVPFFSS